MYKGLVACLRLLYKGPVLCLQLLYKGRLVSYVVIGSYEHDIEHRLSGKK